MVAVRRNCYPCEVLEAGVYASLGSLAIAGFDSFFSSMIIIDLWRFSSDAMRSKRQEVYLSLSGFHGKHV